MLKDLLARAVNVPGLLGHLRENRALRQQDRSERELDLYRKMFGSEFLHVGYFADPDIAPEAISLKQLTDAMQAYADLVLHRIGPDDAGQRVVDIGCGVGGLLRMLQQRGLEAHGVTPNAIHAAAIRERIPGVTVHNVGFQDLKVERPFDFATSTEALHNVPIDQAFPKLIEVIRPGGRLILIDYYRLTPDAKSHSGWLLNEFEAALARYRVEVLEMTDIGLNVLPTMKLAHCWATRLGTPLIEYNVDRFLINHPYLGWFLKTQRQRLQDKMDKLEVLDPTIQAREKTYRVYQLKMPA